MIGLALEPTFNKNKNKKGIFYLIFFGPGPTWSQLSTSTTNQNLNGLSFWLGSSTTWHLFILSFVTVIFGFFSFLLRGIRGSLVHFFFFFVRTKLYRYKKKTIMWKNVKFYNRQAQTFFIKNINQTYIYVDIREILL